MPGRNAIKKKDLPREREREREREKKEEEEEEEEEVFYLHFFLHSNTSNCGQQTGKERTYFMP